MTYTVALPRGGRRSRLDIVEPFSTMIQRQLRHEGLASYEPATAAALLATFEGLDDGFSFFDVGANIGLYAMLCASMFDPSAVHAFEPTPTTAEVARRLASANGLPVEIVESAASNRRGQASFYLSDTTDASNSLIEGFKPSGESITVDTIRLDDYVEQMRIDPSVLKIDVETHEAEVLDGALETIARCRPFIVIEVLNRNGHDHGTEISDVMKSFGYSFYDLSDAPPRRAHPMISGSGRETRDWLLAPEPLGDDFGARWQTWFDRLAECGPDRNSRLPYAAAAARAWQRAGVRGLAGSAWRQMKRSVGDDPADALDQLARRVRRSAPGRAVGGSILRRQYGTSSKFTNRAIERFNRYDVPDADERGRSVVELVDLFFDLCEIADVELFVEAGAKDAGASRRAAEHPGRQVVAFEANPYTYRRFGAEFDESAVDYRHLALTDTNGPVRFLVRRDVDGDPIADGQGSLLRRPDHTAGYEEVTVEGTTLDHFLTPRRALRSALWIDVEGAISSVLRGAMLTLSHTEVLFAEVETVNRWDGQEWLLNDLIAFLAANGLEPVARDEQSRHQFNVLFLRTDLRGRSDVQRRLSTWRRSVR